MTKLRKASKARIANAILVNNIIETGESDGSCALEVIENGERIHHACIIKDGDKAIAWGIVSDLDFEENKLQIYVAPPYRRKGLGSRIYKHLKKKCAGAKPMPWDYKSRAFYKKNEKTK